MEVTNPYTKINLVRNEFKATLAEMKQLTETDRLQLASAIARNKGLTEAQCGFQFVEY